MTELRKRYARADWSRFTAPAAGKTRLAVETLLARGGGCRAIVFVSLATADDTPAGLLGAVRDALG
jgi:hypothetical protein